MIKNVVFDFGCVLTDLDKQRCVDAFNAIGAQNVSRYVDECKQEDLFHDLETGLISVEEFCEEVRRKAPLCRATNQEICQAWDSLLAGVPQRRLEKLLEVGRNHRVLLLSNTNAIHWKKAVECYFTDEEHTLEDYFERCFLSYEMHTVKPDSEIFLRMMREAAVNAAETLFIDDSKANCMAAERLGITTLNVSHGDEWLDEIDNILMTNGR